MYPNKNLIKPVFPEISTPMKLLISKGAHKKIFRRNIHQCSGENVVHI